MKNGVITRSLPTSVVIPDAMSLDTHTSAMGLILDIVNRLLGYSGSSAIQPVQITSPRTLHNVFRSLTLLDSDVKIIRSQIPLLRFKPETYDLSSTPHFISVMKKIVHREFFEDSVPILMRTDVMITKDPVLSALAAYGAMAPSISGDGTTVSLPIVGKATYKANIGKDLSLAGVPIFYKPLTKAYEDWDSVRTRSTVTFKTKFTKGNTSKVIAGLSRWIPFSEGGDSINDVLSLWSMKEKENKMKRARLEDVEAESEAPVSKKMRSVKKVSLADLGFSSDGEEEGMETD